MRFEFIQTSVFTRQAQKHGLSIDDVRDIEATISLDPLAFPLIRATGGLRKMRFAPAAAAGGKSSGIRVCYFAILDARHIYLVTLFAKNEKANLTKAESQLFSKMLAAIRAGYTG